MHSCLGSNCNKELNQLHGKALMVLQGVVHVVVAKVVVMVDRVGLIKDLQNPLLPVLEMHCCYCNNNNNGQAKWLVNNVVRMWKGIALRQEQNTRKRAFQATSGVHMAHMVVDEDLINEKWEPEVFLGKYKIGSPELKIVPPPKEREPSHLVHRRNVADFAAKK